MCECETAGYRLFEENTEGIQASSVLASYVGERRPTRSIVGISYL